MVLKGIALALCVLLLVGIGLFLFMVLEAHQSTVKNHVVPLAGLPSRFNGFSIYFISDVHRRRVSTSMLNQLTQPDILIIGGDLTEKGVPFDRVEENLKRLSQFNCPLLFVWGNHDLQVDPFQLRTLLNKYGVTILTNDVFRMDKDGERLVFIGVHDATNALDCLEIPLLKEEKGIRIVISHNPLIRTRVKKEMELPLILSGHTHGGQIRLFGWGIREKGGIKPTESGFCIISNGYGTTRLPLRLGAPPDTLWVQLTSAEVKK